MQKKISIILSLLIAIFILTPTSSSAEEDTKLLGGAVIEKGRTLLPLRSIFEALGATVDWNQETKSIKAKNENITIELTLDSKNVKVNGLTKTLDVPAKLVVNKTMVPVRFVSESLGAEVSWDQENRIALITYQGQQINVLAQQSYLRDTNYKYTYVSMNTWKEEKREEVYIGKESGFNKWERLNSAEDQLWGVDPFNDFKPIERSNIIIYEKEDNRGLYEGSKRRTENTINTTKILTYPFEEGTVEGIHPFSGNKIDVQKSVNYHKSITTTAGKFNNVLELENIYKEYIDGGYSINITKDYYAPNIGRILTLSDNEVVWELIKLEKNK